MIRINPYDRDRVTELMEAVDSLNASLVSLLVLFATGLLIAKIGAVILLILLGKFLCGANLPLFQSCCCLRISASFKA